MAVFPNITGVVTEMERVGYTFDVPSLVSDRHLYLTPDFHHVASLCLNIAGLPCTVSAVVLAYYTVYGSLPTTFPPPMADLNRLSEILTSLGMGTFPVYTALYRPGSVATLVLASGFPRPDGAAILFAPRRRFQPPGAPAPLPLAAHYSFVQFRDVGRGVRLPAVYFGPVFLGPWFYWHADKPSPEYYELARLGLACLCSQRCYHEPPEFWRAPCFSFPHYKIRTESLAVVTEITDFSYAHGPSDTLAYRSPSGRLYSVENAFSLYDMADLRETEEETFVTPAMTIKVYNKTNTRVVFYMKHLLVGLAEVFAFSLIVFFFARLMLWWYFSFKTEHLFYFLATLSWKDPILLSTDRFYDNSLFSIVEEILDRIDSLLGFRTILVAGFLTMIIASVLVILGLRRRGYIDISTPPHSTYARGAWPSTMRLGTTPLGARLSDAVSVHNNLRPSELRSMVRRIAHEMRYRHSIDPSEIDEWIRRNACDPGESPIRGIPAGHCVNCLRKKNLHHFLCVDCRHMMKSSILWSPLIPYEMMHVGMRPLYASLPILDTTGFRGWRHPDRPKPLFRGHEIHNLDMVADLLVPLSRRPPTLRGKLCGPMFCGLEPTCFERGEEVLFCAVAARMLVLPPCHCYEVANRAGKQVLYNFQEEYQYLHLLFNYLFPEHNCLLECWTREQVIAHQRNADKRKQLIQCYEMIDNGETPDKERMVVVKPFVKDEKHFRTDYSSGEVVNKNKAVPRCINPVHPLLNAYLAPYTLPTSKHLNRVMHCHSHVFYASGAKPSEINDWLNFASIRQRCVLEDDVSMADGSHSCGSFNFQTKILKFLWGETLEFMPELVRELIHLMRHGRFKHPAFNAIASFVNLSGVPLTSWSNTIVFIIVRLVALAYAYNVIKHPRDYWRHAHFVRRVLDVIYMAVAGDDGVTFLPMIYNGVSIADPAFLQRYSAAWAFFGFSVPASKIRLHYEHQWRLHTFLAMRPYWSGERYEYGVEIARRMRSMFWQHSNNLHPTAWGRGVAFSLLTASKHVPVVSDVCKWYLHVTSGALNPNVSFTNDFSTFYGYNVEGDLTDRTISEFCVDYDIPRASYEEFKSILWSHEDPFINLSHPVLDAIFSKE